MNYEGGRRRRRRRQLDPCRAGVTRILAFRCLGTSPGCLGPLSWADGNTQDVKNGPIQSWKKTQIAFYSSEQGFICLLTGWHRSAFFQRTICCRHLPKIKCRFHCVVVCRNSNLSLWLIYCRLRLQRNDNLHLTVKTPFYSAVTGTICRLFSQHEILSSQVWWTIFFKCFSYFTFLELFYLSNVLTRETTRRLV